MLHKVIYSPKTMTVPQYARYESEQNIKLLIRFWWIRFIPVKWFMSGIEKFTNEFNALFNPESQGNLYREVNKLIFQNKLMLMQALSQAIHVHLVYKVQLDITRAKCGMKPKPDETLADYLQQIHDLTGIEIKTLEDVNAFRDELERSADKFEEIYLSKEKKHPIKAATIMELYFAYCSIMEINPDYKAMTLYEFAELKKLAEARSKKMQEQLKKK